MLSGEIFASDSFRFDPQFMRRLGIDQFARFEGGTLRGPDFSLAEAVLRIQRGTLDQLMSETLAQRLADAEPKADDPRKLLSYAEWCRPLSDAVWSELAAGRDIDSLRRNLQREHVRRLATSLLRPTPAAATDVLPAHRAEARRLQATLSRAAGNAALNPATRAHVSESHVQQRPGRHGARGVDGADGPEGRSACRRPGRPLPRHHDLKTGVSVRDPALRGLL